MYITYDGQLGIQDLRSKANDMTFNLGLEKGFISSLIPIRGETNCCIGTMKGNLLLFDLRANLIINSYRLNED